jgi:hypothetical protein
MSYKSPVDGRELVEVKRPDAKEVVYRDQSTGQEYNKDYAEANFEEYGRDGKKSAKTSKTAKTTRKPRANKQNGVKDGPKPKDNGQANDESPSDESPSDES